MGALYIDALGVGSKALMNPEMAPMLGTYSISPPLMSDLVNKDVVEPLVARGVPVFRTSLLTPSRITLTVGNRCRVLPTPNIGLHEREL